MCVLLEQSINESAAHPALDEDPHQEARQCRPSPHHRLGRRAIDSALEVLRRARQLLHCHLLGHDALHGFGLLPGAAVDGGPVGEVLCAELRLPAWVDWGYLVGHCGHRPQYRLQLDVAVLVQVRLLGEHPHNAAAAFWAGRHLDGFVGFDLLDLVELLRQYGLVVFLQSLNFRLLLETLLSEEFQSHR